MINKLRKLARKTLGLQSWEDLTVQQHRAMWPAAKELQEKHIRNCQLLVNREKMLEYMPKDAVCAEIGIWKCDFSEKIINITQPKKFHLVDLDQAAIKIANQKFAQEILDGKVIVHTGDSSEIIMSMPDNYFDWIYIDGDHLYEGVKKDLEAARLKLKPDGLIVMNDYIFLSPIGLTKYGVIEAINEFCLKYDFELIYFAFQGRGYNDVVLRRI
jgi:Methyltransferase domain